MIAATPLDGAQMSDGPQSGSCGVVVNGFAERHRLWRVDDPFRRDPTCNSSPGSVCPRRQGP